MSTTVSVYEHGLTRSQLSILGYIASRQSADKQGAALTKAEIAKAVGCSVKTVERAVVRFRAEGIIESSPRYGEDGGQLGNVYFMGWQVSSD